MPTYNSVVEAVVGRYDASFANVENPNTGGLWFDEIPEDKNLDNGAFVALTNVADRGPMWTTEAAYTEVTRFTFEIYAVGMAKLTRTISLIRAQFDKPGDEAAAIFVVTGARVMGCQRQETVYANVGERTATGEKVYSARMTYEIGARYSL